MTAAAIDQAKADAFAQRMIDVLNHTSLGLMTSIGHQVGLFDVMAGLPPSTSPQIAAAASLNERYVREWLGAMTAARVVFYDAASSTYVLPAEHAASLTRAAGPANLAGQTPFFPMLASVEEKLIECFRNGGGVPYSAYRRFQRLMAEDSASVHDAALIDTILPLVPGLPEQLKAGIDVADIGCGSGHAINLMARAYPNSRFTGYDISDEGIAAGRAEAARWGLSNAQFEVRDVTVLAMENRFDFVTAFDAIHDQAHPAQVLAGIARTLRPGGTFLMVDIRASSRLEENLDHPFATMLYTLSTMHCMTVSLALGGAGLGTVWGEQLARQMLAEAGFDGVEVRSVAGDAFNSYFIATKRA
ncbi:MAG TPA: methyltransferase domain-containing protein [Dehalococcoidia bacterium]|nr:methyltransferase domain-containing protein [Dehalococcoidia bacterium]